MPPRRLPGRTWRSWALPSAITKTLLSPTTFMSASEGTTTTLGSSRVRTWPLAKKPGRSAPASLGTRASTASVRVATSTAGASRVMVPVNALSG